VDKLLFIYDNLMTVDEQVLAEIPLEFLSLGQMQGRLRWFNDTKKRRLFAVPNNGYSTKVIYGGIFLLKEYEHFMHKLHSYYHNSFPYTNRTIREDMYVLTPVSVRPLKISSLSGLAKGEYEVGEAIMCETFIGNTMNPQIKNSMKKRYYEHKNIYAPSYLQMVKENYNTKEE